MRQIGSIPIENDAKKFGDFLLVQEISNNIENDSAGSWAVWVHDEEMLEPARQHLQNFLRNPQDPAFSAAAPTAARLRRQQEKENEGYAKKIQDGRLAIGMARRFGLGPLTGILIAISVAVYVLEKVIPNPTFFWLYISNNYVFGRSIAERLGCLAEIRHGQFWRLISPIFLHFGIVHIFFNMLWLRDLGNMIETHLSTVKLLLFILVVASLSNVGQYLVSGHEFGGMSGVVYGLLGYIWIRGRFDPACGLYLHQTTVTMMIVWFFLCLAGFFGSVANTAHGVGLMAGMGWGYFDAHRRIG